MLTGTLTAGSTFGTTSFTATSFVLTLTSTSWGLSGVVATRISFLPSGLLSCMRGTLARGVATVTVAAIVILAGLVIAAAAGTDAIGRPAAGRRAGLHRDDPAVYHVQRAVLDDAPRAAGPDGGVGHEDGLRLRRRDGEAGR